MALGSAAVSLWRVGSPRQWPALLPAILLSPCLRVALSRVAVSPFPLSPCLLVPMSPILRVLGVPVSSAGCPRSQWRKP
jgi:hypothetical protein